MIRRLAVCAVLLLNSCATSPPAADLTRPLDVVQVPPRVISVPCVTQEKIPAFPAATTRDPVKADGGQLVSGIEADALVYQQYAVKLYGVLQGCATAPVEPVK